MSPVSVLRPPKYARSSSLMIGNTLRLTDTRGSRAQPAAAQASRKIVICSACRWSNGTPVSSVRSVELIRLMPCSAVQRAVARVPEPHQIRSGSPGDCGWIGSRALNPVISGSDGAMPAPSIAARKVRVCSRAMSASVRPAAGTCPNHSAPLSAGSGDPRLRPSCRRPPLIRSAAAAVSAMYSGLS